MSKLETRLLRLVRKACRDFDLVERNDRILVAVSGGKDSLALLSLLLRLQRRRPHFSLLAVTLDQGFPGFDPEPLRAHFESLGVEHRIARKDVYSAVKALTPPGQIECVVCSRLRRGELYRLAEETGCNKVALGHNRDDLVETFLMSAMFLGAVRSMPARLTSDDGRNTVIRPLAYCPEEWLRDYAREKQLPVATSGCNPPRQQRQRVKELLAAMEREHPAIKSNLLNALGNVVPSHLLDPLLEKRSEAAGAPAGGDDGPDRS